MRILLIEDDDQLGEGLRTGLSMAGHAVDWVTDAQMARAALVTRDYESLVLDIGLPDACGFDLLDEIRREYGTVSVLISTARDELCDRVRGLDAGADDYLVKPFALDEPLIPHRGICLDPASHTVTSNGVLVEMPRREFSLLQLLLTRRGRPLSKSLIEEQLYAWGDEIESNAVEVHVHHLRKKLGADLIRTIRGVGYLIEDEA